MRTNFKVNVLVLSCLAATVSHANFIENSTVNLTAHNYYLDRNFTEEGVAQPAAKEWAQGFILSAKSGYTSGVVGFGADLHATAGFKLWGDRDHSRGAGLLPINPSTGEPENSYGEVGVTLKAKMSATELKYGTLIPFNPMLVGSPARLFPQTYKGINIESKEFDKLTLEASYVDEVNHRDSSNYEPLKLTGANGRFPANFEIDHLYYLGGHYQLSPTSKISLFHSKLDDVFNQYYVGVIGAMPFNEDYRFLHDIRVFHTQDTGAKKAGVVDNLHASVVLGVGYDNHKFMAGYVSNSGDTAMPYLLGGEPFTFLDTWSTDFLNKDEKIYTLRYEYDFKDYVPGLRMMARYTHGKDIDLTRALGAAGQDREETDIGAEVNYQLQSTPLKGLNVRLRYSDYDNDFGPTVTFKSAKETRVNLNYTWKFK